MQAALVADELHDRAFARKVAAQHGEPAGLLQRPVDGHDDLLPRRLLRGGGDLGEGAAVDVQRGRRRRGRPRRSSRATRATPPARWRSVATKRPPGLRSATTGVRVAISSKSSSSSGRPSSRAIASRCRTAFVEPPVAATAAIAFSIDARVRIVEGRTSPRTSSSASLPALFRSLGFRRVERGDPVQPRRADAEELERKRHRVGRELAAARAGARTRDALELVHVLRAHRAGGMRAHRLEHVLDGHVATAEAARRDRAVVEHEPRQVEPGEGHHGGGDRLVAADEDRRARRRGGRARRARSSPRSPRATRARRASPRCPSRRRPTRRSC